MKFSSVPVIRTIAIVSVIVIHATNEEIITQMNQMEFYRWLTVDVYQSIARVAGIPLFVMLSGFLLLQPEKYNEPVSFFLKKRWNRLAIPVIFFAIVYFIYDFTVKNEPITSRYVVQSLLSGGPYFHFWFIYMIIGLYLLTPLIRALLPNMNKKLLMYFTVIWFAGVSLTPLVPMFGFVLNSDIFLITGFVGYFILGAYLPKIKIEKKQLLALITVGILSISIGTYYMAWIGNPKLYYFHEYLSPFVILTSMMLFILLSNNSYRRIQSQGKISWLINTISENTLPIFLLHIIIMESLESGYFGFIISGNSLNSIIEVPILTLVTLTICLAIIIPLRKIPIIRKMLGN